MAERKLLVLTDDWVEEPAPPVAAPVSPEPQVGADESWWVEPEPDEDSAAEAEPVADVEPVTEPEKESRFGHFVRSTRVDEPVFAEEDEAEPIGDQETDIVSHDTASDSEHDDEAESQRVEEDTEAFLEKVFSQLDVDSPADIEEEGHGLLRRRRMGSVLKDIDED